jgi:hypothetical protein
VEDDAQRRVEIRRQVLDQPLERLDAAGRGRYADDAPRRRRDLRARLELH